MRDFSLLASESPYRSGDTDSARTWWFSGSVRDICGGLWPYRRRCWTSSSTPTAHLYRRWHSASRSGAQSSPGRLGRYGLESDFLDLQKWKENARNRRRPVFVPQNLGNCCLLRILLHYCYGFCDIILPLLIYYYGTFVFDSFWLIWLTLLFRLEKSVKNQKIQVRAAFQSCMETDISRFFVLLRMTPILNRKFRKTTQKNWASITGPNLWRETSSGLK